MIENKSYDKLYAYYHLSAAIFFTITTCANFETGSKTVTVGFDDAIKHFDDGFALLKFVQTSKYESEPFEKYYKAFFGKDGAFQRKDGETNKWKTVSPNRWKNPEMIDTLGNVVKVMKDLNKEYLSTLPDKDPNRVKLTEESPEADKKEHMFYEQYCVSRGTFALVSVFDKFIKTKKRDFGYDTLEAKVYDIFYEGVFGDGEGAFQAEAEAFAKSLIESAAATEAQKNVAPKEPEPLEKPKEEKIQPDLQPPKVESKPVKPKRDISIGDFFAKVLSVLALPFVKAGQGIWWFIKNAGFGLGKFFAWLWSGICYIGVGIGRGFRAIFHSEDGSAVGFWFGMCLLLFGVMATLGLLHVFEVIVDFFNFGLGDVNLVYSSFSIVEWAMGLSEAIQDSVFLIWLILMLPLLALVIVCGLIDLILTIITGIFHLLFHFFFILINILFQTVLPFVLAGFFIFMTIRAYLDSSKSVGQMISMIFSILLALGSIVFFYL